MNAHHRCLRLALLAMVGLLSASVAADEIADWTIRQGYAYRLQPNIIYLVADGHESKLDVNGPRDTEAPRLHKALDRAKVPNRLTHDPRQGHGNFLLEESRIAWVIKRFLTQHGD